MSERIEMPLPREKMDRWEIYKLVPNAAGRPHTYEFVDYLATQFKVDVTTPENFLLQIELAFGDLRRGTDAFSGAPIRHEAVDRVPTVEMFVRMDLSAIIDVLFSPEHAAAIKKCQKEVLAEAKALEPAYIAARYEEQRQQVDAHLNAINTPKATSSPLTAALSKPKKRKAKKVRRKAKKVNIGTKPRR